MIPYPGMAPMMMPPGIYIVPKPKGPPTKIFFNLGAASSLVCMVMSFITGVLFLLGLLFNYGEHSLVEPEQFFGMMYVTGFALIPLALSYYGFYRNYGSKAAVVGMAGFFTLMPFFYLLWGFYLVQEMTNSYGGIETLVLVVSSCSFFGGALLFLTVPLWKFRHYMLPYTPARRNTSVALAIMIAASISLAVFFGVFVFGWILLAVALFALFLAFRSAPVPDAPPAQDTTVNTISSQVQGLPPGPGY